MAVLMIEQSKSKYLDSRCESFIYLMSEIAASIRLKKKLRHKAQD